MSQGPIEKIAIRAYLDRLFEKPNPKAPQPFYLPVNPENYSQSLKVVADNRRGHGDQKTDPSYISTAPEELKLDFFFDGTEAIENYKYTDPSKRSVRQQMNQFLETVYKMEGQIHRPNFLKIQWGKNLTFKCILSSLDIQYTLFEANGDPLRAKVSATFHDYVAKEVREKEEKKHSPDLTHNRMVKAGDRLDLMTHDIYADTKYLLQVAKFNKLRTIRRLKPGAALAFPPIEKPGATETVLTAKDSLRLGGTAP